MSQGIAYAVPSRIPGIAANSIQVMKMAEALMALDPDLLMIAARGEGTGQDLQAHYGVSRLPRMVLLDTATRFGPYRLALAAVMEARRAGKRLFLTRSVVAAAFAALAGLDTVWECHAPPQGAELVFFRLLARLPRFRRLVVISEALRAILAGRHPEMARLDVLVAHDGVDPPRFAGLPSAAEAKAAAGRDPARLVAGYSGHLYAGRGVDTIVAMAKARPDWDFLLLGGTGQDIAAWRERTAGMRNLAFGGFVPNGELPGRLAVCDALLMPYQRNLDVAGGKGYDTSSWMSPLKMFEYMAMGRAIIASDLPVLREVLDESTAIFVAPDHSAAWIDTLDRLADSATRNRLGSAAVAAASTYAWPARVRTILAGLA